MNILCFYIMANHFKIESIDNQAVHCWRHRQVVETLHLSYTVKLSDRGAHCQNLETTACKAETYEV